MALILDEDGAWLSGGVRVRPVNRTTGMLLAGLTSLVSRIMKTVTNFLRRHPVCILPAKTGNIGEIILPPLRRRPSSCEISSRIDPVGRHEDKSWHGAIQI